MTSKRQRALFFTLVLGIALESSSLVFAQSDKLAKGEAKVKSILKDFHLAASKADSERYFKYLARDAVFLGTDATERFSVKKLKAFAQPYFSKGIGWTYVPSKQHVFVGKGGELAWFDEQLDNEKYGVVRGSGVLRKINDDWKIVQYNLSFVVPNQLVPDLVQQIAKATNTTLPRSVTFADPTERKKQSPKQEAAAVLMDFHRAAAEADGKRYFGYFARDAIVFGTDPKERFTVEQLRAYIGPFLAQGTGWTSVPSEQNVFLAKNGQLAWFDERVISSKYGEMRGTGVLRKVQGRWKIAHFNTSFPVPNELAKPLIKKIRELPKSD